MRLFLAESRAPRVRPSLCVNTERILPANSLELPSRKNTRINTRNGGEERRGGAGNVRESRTGGGGRERESFRTIDRSFRRRKTKEKDAKERERESFLAKNRSSREPFQKHVCLSSRNSSFLRSCKREKGRCGQVNDPLSRGWRGLATLLKLVGRRLQRNKGKSRNDAIRVGEERKNREHYMPTHLRSTTEQHCPTHDGGEKNLRETCKLSLAQTRYAKLVKRFAQKRDKVRRETTG